MNYTQNAYLCRHARVRDALEALAHLLARANHHAAIVLALLDSLGRHAIVARRVGRAPGDSRVAKLWARIFFFFAKHQHS
jgi:hypothetical protein